MEQNVSPRWREHCAERLKRWRVEFVGSGAAPIFFDLEQGIRLPLGYQYQFRSELATRQIDLE